MPTSLALLVTGDVCAPRRLMRRSKQLSHRSSQQWMVLLLTERARGRHQVPSPPDARSLRHALLCSATFTSHPCPGAVTNSRSRDQAIRTSLFGQRNAGLPSLPDGPFPPLPKENICHFQRQNSSDVTKAQHERLPPSFKRRRPDVVEAHARARVCPS